MRNNLPYPSSTFDPAQRRSILDNLNAAAPKGPEREIPAVVAVLKERLEALNSAARHLRERLAPVTSEPTPDSGDSPAAISKTSLGAELEVAIAWANELGEVLQDIHNRLEL